ncbi:MAG: hypothetical protein ACJ768_14900 [Gaiellaceae bacterium]
MMDDPVEQRPSYISSDIPEGWSLEELRRANAQRPRHTLVGHLRWWLGYLIKRKA